MKGIELKLSCLAAVICLGAVSLGAASAQEQPPDKDGWDFRLGFPLWAAATQGTIGANNHDVHLDQSFSDMLESLDFTFPLNLEIRKSRWLFFSDGLYLKTSSSGEPRGIFSGAQVQLDQKLALDDLAIGYAVVKNECFSLEAFAGAQLVFVEPKLTLDRPIVDRSASTSKFWADPIVGVYLHYRFYKALGFYAKADVGGFDVSSRLTWQVEGGLDISIARNFYGRLAYHYLNTDYDKGGFTYDVSLSGPQLEFGLRF